jgi:hypothetical protein
MLSFVREKKFLTVVAAIFVAGFFIYPLLNATALLVTKNIVDRETNSVSQGLMEDRAYALDQVKDIIDSGTISAYLAAGDRDNTLAVLNAEAQKRGLSTMTAVDKNGVAIARIPNLGVYGDFAAQTEEWGRAAAAGIAVTAIGPGRTYPLIMLAAAPIVSSGTVVGAIYGGYRFDDAYARSIRNKYLTGTGAQVLFYTMGDGRIGDSFNDPTDKTAVAGYFNQGSDWIQHGHTDETLSLDGKDYFVRNVVLRDPNAPYAIEGGMLIFFPTSNFAWYEIVIAGLGLGLFTFFVAWHLVVSHEGEITRRKYRIWIVALGILTFVAASYAEQYALQRNIPLIERPHYAIYNSTLSFVPDSDLVDLAHEQRISVNVITGGEAVNAFEAVVHFDPSLVRVTEIETTNSICGPEFFIERSIDNTKGEVNVTCAIPTPGFTGQDGTIADLLVQPLHAGSFSLNFSTGTQVLANDGLGTDVLRTVTDGNYQVGSIIMATSSGGTPVVSLFSPSHSNSERWYNLKDVQIFLTSVPGSIYHYTLDQDPVASLSLNDPSSSETTSSSVALHINNDGVYYFHVAAQKDSIIGPTTNFKIQIDTTPPAAPQIAMSQATVKKGDVVRFDLNSSDSESGLQSNYYVKIDNSIFFPALPDLDIPFVDSGSHTVTVRVFDNAGNYSDSEITVQVGS